MTGNEMLAHVQILEHNGEATLVVPPFDEYVELRALLSDEEKLADYLDCLHAQNVKAQDSGRHTLAEVKAIFEVD